MKEKDKNIIFGHWKLLGNGIVQNQKGIQGKINTIGISPQYDPSIQSTIYQKRKQYPVYSQYFNQQIPLVKIYGYQIVTDIKDEYNRVFMRIVTEPISNTLENTPQLTFSESLYVLQEALKGFEYAQSQCGPFIINQNMIAFTLEGKVKVWVNRNFVNNHPEQRIPYLQSTHANREILLINRKKRRHLSKIQFQIINIMIESILRSVEQHCQNGKYPQPFRSEVRGLDFSETIELIQQTFRLNKLYKPDRIDLEGNRVKIFRQENMKKRIIPRPSTYY